MPKLNYQYTEHKRFSDTFIALEYWTVEMEDKTLTSICLEINFQDLPLMKVGDKYVSHELYTEFEQLCVDPTLYRNPKKLLDFLDRCTKK